MDAFIIDNAVTKAGYGFITLRCHEFTKSYAPGQLCMLQVRANGTTDPLLRRPFAPYSVNKEKGELSILYAIVGRGTRLLTEARSGNVLSLSIPQGRGFDIAKNMKVALVAGGVGIAPMHCLAEALYENGCNVHIYYGGRTSDMLFSEVKKMPPPFRWVVSTDDGSFGRKGFVTEALAEDIKSFSKCYTTGPTPMMKVVHNICTKAGVPLDVSMEEIMACGIGVCGGCLIPIKHNGVIAQQRCCTEGPTFSSSEVFYE